MQIGQANIESSFRAHLNGLLSSLHIASFKSCTGSLTYASLELIQTREYILAHYHGREAYPQLHKKYLLLNL